MWPVSATAATPWESSDAGSVKAFPSPLFYWRPQAA
jgi:hypothetical protein